MPVITYNDQSYTLRLGQNTLGAAAGADVRVAGNAALGVLAIIVMSSDSNVVIRRAGSTTAVRVNGVQLVDPVPLIHGDKVEVAGNELLYAEDAKAGATQFVSASEIAAIAAHKRAGPAKATAATGGRLVSLVDGKEYAISASGVTIGRDAGCDVVVAKNEVSRKHAEVTPVEGGYEIRDFSANGVFLNGTRVEKSQTLSRADVIKIGDEEFRFYADSMGIAATPPMSQPAAPAAPVAPPRPAAAPPAAPPAPPAPPRAVAPPVAAPPTAPTPKAPAAPPAAPVAPDARPVLAVLEVTNEGPTKGQQYELRVPLSHVGRGAHNDISIADESVSDTHAKLQRRDDGWYVVDAGSTNGTYVGGHRIDGERKLEGAPDVRFGGVKMIFRPRDVATDVTKGTRAIASVDRSKLRPTAQAAPQGSPQSTARIPSPTTANASINEPPPRQGIPIWVWGIVALAVAAVVFFLMKR